MRWVAESEAVEHAAQEVEVHATDELTLLLGEPVERTVGERDLFIT